MPIIERVCEMFLKISENAEHCYDMIFSYSNVLYHLAKSIIHKICYIKF